MSAPRTLHQINDVLCGGYIRNECIDSESEDSYPIELNQIICGFVGNFLLRFDTASVAHAEINVGKYILDNGKEIKSNTYNVIIVGCSLGVSKGIHEFQIECIKAKDDAIGIISDIDSCKHSSRMNILSLMENNAKGHRYFWYASNGIYESKNLDTKGNVKTPSIQCTKKWRNNDTLRIRIDCNVWTVSFLYDNEDIGKLDIEPNMTYYLFLCTEWATSNYRLIAD